jgi:hypothetical protein
VRVFRRGIRNSSLASGEGMARVQGDASVVNHLEFGDSGSIDTISGFAGRCIRMDFAGRLLELGAGGLLECVLCNYIGLILETVNEQPFATPSA